MVFGLVVLLASGVGWWGSCHFWPLVYRANSGIFLKMVLNGCTTALREHHFWGSSLWPLQKTTKPAEVLLHKRKERKRGDEEAAPKW